ncbi:MAG: hypothetical protein Q8Q01_00480 [archaeon]|nr:hypothetical protein [archaeon]
MERKVSSKKYALALILTIVVFSVGIFVGMFFEDLRLSYSEKMILEEKANLQSLQLQQRYIDSGLADCETLNKILESNTFQLTKKMGRVIDYNKNAVFNQEELRLQLQDYFLTEIQFMLLSQEIDKKCSQDSLKIIYFYNEDEFDTQGQILDYIKKIFEDRILVFSFDSNFKDEPLIDILLTSHKIEQFPSVVIENSVFQGHTTTEELMKDICGKLDGLEKESPEECSTILNTQQTFFKLQ